MTEAQSSVHVESHRLLPPPPGSFIDREELIQQVGDFAISQGYVVTIKQSKKDKYVVLGCDRGGVYRKSKTGENSSDERSQKRKSSTRTNCPFELFGKKDKGLWVLSIRNGTHNHEPFKDISEHPSARRFTEEQVLAIKEMTESGLKPRQILKRLRQSDPGLLSTPRHLYNVKTKLRQGNFSVKKIKSLRPKNCLTGNLPSAAEPSWRQHYPPRLPNFIGGKFIESKSLMLDVLNPATQQVVSLVPLTNIEEFKAAVLAAKRASSSWRDTPVSIRQRSMFLLLELIRRDTDKLAMCIVTEQGITLKEAYGHVQHGLEMVERACDMTSLQMEDFASNVSDGVDAYTMREAHGICAGVCLSNAPAISPLWMFPIAITCGNTYILKAPGKDPGVSTILAELTLEAGFPNGVLNIIHGTDDIINAICDDDDIKAVSVVASRTAGMAVCMRASSKGKRVQSYIESKSLAIAMPDAPVGSTVDALIGAAFGAAGHRLMALGAAIFVGDSKPWECQLVEHARALKVNAGIIADVDIGPVISKEDKERLSKLIEFSCANGARLMLDGRNITVPGYQRGNFIGPCILGDITTDMECYKGEYFGPLLLCIQADDLEKAIGIVNANRQCKGASIFTTSGAAARKFQREIEVDQVGINVSVAVPLPFFTFTDPTASSSGDINSAKAGVEFFIHVKTVTQKWDDFPSNNEPTLSEINQSTRSLDSMDL
ncbi:hypothetical protein Droror1_Dr00007032 [Drosera rotundifolia]